MLAILFVTTVIAIGGVLFTLFHLSRRARAVGRLAITPAAAEPGREVCLVGIAQPAEAPGTSPITDRPVLWLRAFRTTRGLIGSSRGNASNSRSIGKVSTRFLLVDETAPESSVTIESNRISDIQVLVQNRRFSRSGMALTDAGARGDPLHAFQALLKFHVLERAGTEERAIYPGERIWAHGKLKERDGALCLGGFSAWLDDLSPEDRVAWSGAYARAGGVVSGAAAVVALISLLFV